MSDAALIEACTAFADLEAEITAYERTYLAELRARESKPRRRKPRNADHALAELIEPIVLRMWARDRDIRPPPHPRAGELEALLDQVCDLEASSLAGLAARTRAIRRIRHAVDEFACDWHDEPWARMRNAQVRDLHAILGVDDEGYQRAPAEVLARGTELARSLARRVVN